MTDDDLRFGDISGSGTTNGIVDLLIKTVQVLILVYVILRVVELLFNIPVPLL